MKKLLFLTACLVPTLLMAQEISFGYDDNAGTPVTLQSITRDTKFLIIDNNNLTKFSIDAKKLAPKQGLAIWDEFGDTLTFLPTDKHKKFTVTSTLNRSSLTFALRDENGKDDIFAKFRLLDPLPQAGIDLLNNNPILSNSSQNPCAPCTDSGRYVQYDYATNYTSYKNKLQDPANNYPQVGRPFTFRVVNINPFRDSVIIGSETASYNTDAPALFTKAFFPAGTAQGEKKFPTDSLLADVIALGEQIEKAKAVMQDFRECDNICTTIQAIRQQVETYFHRYGFDPANGPLTSWLRDHLTSIQPEYKAAVISALNNYQAFYTAKNYFYYYIPQVQNVDEYIFNLTIMPKSGAKSSILVDHQPIGVPVLGGYKIDFSSGLFITGLRNQGFNLRPDSSVIHNSYGGDSIVYHRRFKITEQTEKKKVDFGVAAFMHYYPRISRSFNLGLSLGAGVSIGTDPSIRYLGGISALIGRNGRFAVSYGCAAGFVDVLDDSYHFSDFVPGGDKKALTKKSFQTSSFWAVSFNIPLFKNKVVAAPAADTKTADTKADTSPKTSGDATKK